MATQIRSLPGFYEPFRHLGERIADWFAPRAEAKASNAHYEITMELPGVTQEDIDVSLHEGVLTVKGEKRSERKEEGEGYFFSEREYGRFQRTFRLPADARANSTQVEPLSSHPARRLHRLAGRSAWWYHGQVRAGARILGGRPPDANPLGPLEFSPSPARRRLPVDPLRAAHRRLVSRKIQVAERLYLGGTCSSDGSNLLEAAAPPRRHSYMIGDGPRRTPGRHCFRPGG